MELAIEHLAQPTDDARALVDELDAELTAAYSAEQRHGFDIERLFKPNVLFFISRLDGEAVGCGGIAFDGEVAELKRMYVRPEHRGRKVAEGVLARLEEEARRRGVKRLVLETGDAQQRAIAFYSRCGFTRCDAFGDYTKMPPAATVRSVFMEKGIG
jgi:putative acetyltransferase